MALTCRIMVVDDEIDILQIVRRILEKWGFEVETFSNPLHAYGIFKSNPKRYSLVLTDVRMPEISGISLAVMFRQIRSDIKILIMTAYDITLKEINADAPEAKPLEIMSKPFKTQTVCETVRRHVPTPA
jgi:DNA-binding NtrC family response regulator